MTDPDAQARARYFIITLTRIGGVALAVAGIVLIGRNTEGVTLAAGYALVAVGLIDMAVVPRLLAKRWRTPPE